MPTSANRLNALLKRSLDDKTAEPTFFRAMLEATVYAHVPLSDDSRNLRLIQFTRPDGLTVLPFFSDNAQATAATGNAVRVVSLLGRVLLEATRGAILMLNPNGIHCTLYPEEIAALLDHGEIATVEKLDVMKEAFQFRAPERSSAWLIDPLVELYAKLTCVEAAYLIEIRSPDDQRRPRLLIALAAPMPDSERAARATNTIVQPLCHGWGIGVDLMAFDPSTEGLGWIAEAGVEPFYQRATARS